jgi:hypothetical protein
MWLFLLPSRSRNGFNDFAIQFFNTKGAGENPAPSRGAFPFPPFTRKGG